MQAHFLNYTPQAIFILIDFALAAAMLFAGRSVFSKDTPLWKSPDFILSTAIATVIFGFGFLLQPLVSELFGPSALQVGTIYFLEFQTGAAIWNGVLNVVTFGFLPGIGFALLINRTRFGLSPAFASVAAALLLIAYDLLKFAETWCYHILVGTTFAPFNLGYSVFSDVFGGPVAAVLCLWAFKTARQHLKKGALPFAGAIIASLFGISALAVAFYGLFIHPLPAESIIVLRKYSTALLKYAQPENADLQLFPEDTILARYNNKTFWSVPVIGSSAWTYGGDLFRLKFHGHAESGTIDARVIGTIGCTPEEAAEMALDGTADTGVQIDLSEADVQLTGVTQRLSIIPPDNDATGTVFIPYGTPVQVSSRSNVPGRTFYFQGAAEYEIPLQNGTAVVLSAFPDAISYYESQHAVPKTLAQLGNPVLSTNRDGETHDLRLPRSYGNSRACRRTDFVNPAAEEQNISANDPLPFTSFVVLVEGKMDEATLTLHLAGVGLDVPPKKVRFGETYTRSNVNYFAALIEDGELSIGTRRFDLRQNDSLIAAGTPLSMHESDDGTLLLRGGSRYVLINGHLVNPSLWSGLEIEIRVLLIGAVITTVGWMTRKRINTLWRAAIR